ncbi:PDGLE domain-containing protein [Gordonia alkanivorans]|uniref:PDGLE domain-containing protein n=1 Tax=Gordonia alkanivorans TaxID=84096 RepID=UPI0005A907F9|nr:PDGLE domain-containing protein [Gordonia alkanivorans]
MSDAVRTGRLSRRMFLTAFAVVALILAGVVSYLASSAPDGLDSTTLQGCEMLEASGAEQLVGTCIAQHATEHSLAGSPLADYAVNGTEMTNGIAGVIGVTITLMVAFCAFRVVAWRPRQRTSAAD